MRVATPCALGIAGLHFLVAFIGWQTLVQQTQIAGWGHVSHERHSMRIVVASDTYFRNGTRLTCFVVRLVGCGILGSVCTRKSDEVRRQQMLN